VNEQFWKGDGSPVFIMAGPEAEARYQKLALFD